MSAISSLYGSPNPSMVSRDPAGVGVDEYIRLEPTGSRAEDSAHHVISPSSAAQSHKDGGMGPMKSLQILDVARLVGAPPPPPKTPPPKRVRRRTPKHNNTKAGVTPKMTNVGSFTSFDEDSLLQSLAASSPKSTELASMTENGEKTIHTRNTSGSSSPDSVKIDIPPHRTMEYEHQLTVPIDIIEERVRAAMQLYEREELVLDDGNQASDDGFRPAMAIIENKLGLPLVLPTELDVDKINKAASPRDLLPSPTKEASRPHQTKTREKSKTFVASLSTLNNVHESPMDAVSPKNMEPPGQQLPEPYRRTRSAESQHENVNEVKQKRDMKRGFFKKLFRGRTKNRGEAPKSRDSSPAVPASPRSRSSPMSKSSPKSISSQRSRSRSSSRIASSPRSRSRSSPRRSPSPRGYMSVSSPRSNASPRRPKDPAMDNRQPVTKPASPRVSMSHPKRQPQHLKPVLKSEIERQYQGPTVTAQIEQKPDLVIEEPTVSLPTPIVNHKVQESVSNMEMNEKSLFVFSQDPPDDEHGDPPEFSGRPLISPTSYGNHRVTPKNDDEVSRLESVKSRIAELYQGRAHDTEEEPDDGPLSHLPSSFSHDRNDYFFAQDEVSALTGTFGSKSFDPFGNDSNEEQTVDQEGPTPREVSADIPRRTFVDSNATSLVNSISTPAHVSNLRVQIQGPSQDPAGASPMKWSYRGHPLMEAGFRDPVGESPLHAWTSINPKDNVADPPLTTGFVEDDNDAAGIFDEKKEEENVILENPSMSSSNSETPFEKDFMIGQVNNAESKGDAIRKKSSSSLRIAKLNGLVSIDENADSAPTPKSATASARRVASNLITESDKQQGMISAVDTAPESALKEVVKIVVDKNQELTVKTDVEKSGFKSASNTPVSGPKALTITTAAFTNAKAVAYLHRLHGEPSPRHTWHTSNRKQSDLSPLAQKVKARAKKKAEPTSSSSSRKKPSPDEYGAHNFNETITLSDETETLQKNVVPEELHVIKTKEGALFSAYNAKFQGRKPSKKIVPKVETPTGSRLSLSSRGREVELFNDARTTPVAAAVKPGKITGWAVAKGIQLRRNKRDYDIATGKSARIVITPRKKPEGRNRFKFVPQNEDEIKDPIQRAGRRLLSKAAIPIQCAVRRYIARREAIDRMWALIEIQSYCRRWRAETNLQANIHSAVQIQSVFRGWLARDKLNHMHSAATQIQRILRGYLCQAKVYDTMYYIVRIQALFKGCYVRKMEQRKKLAAIAVQKYIRGFRARLEVLRDNKAIPIQAAYRGHKARQEYAVVTASVKTIQSTWRAYVARIAFQFEIVDIIIVQSVVRRWAACRRTKLLRDLELHGPASIIQATWRGHVVCQEYKKQKAARKIQTIWRGFQCYSDYIFTLVDILLVQRTARRWLAIRKKNQLKKERAAVKIQACWRRRKARCTLLFSLVHIIIAQSVARRYLSRFVVQKRQAEIQALQIAEQQKHDAATTIQRIWRGFIGFSHYIIVQYEIARLQAIVRGKLARQAYNLKLGCAIIIQANIRRHLAKTTIEKRLVADAIAESAALALRERNAAKRIQFWWRIVLDWTKEKKAALTIERFFIRVREEVDREIMRRERRKMMKKEKRRQKRRESDEMMLERAWLNTVDENTAAGNFSRDSQDSKSHSALPLREERKPVIRDTPQEVTADLGLQNGLLSPKLSNVGQEVDINGWPIQRVDSSNSRTRPPTDTVPMSTSEDHSEVSNITNPTVFNRISQPPGHYEVPVRPAREKRMSTDDYIKKYGGDGGGVGPQKTQNRGVPSVSSGKPQHFFSDGGSGATMKKERPVNASLPVILPPNPQMHNVNPVHVPNTPTSRRRSSSSPKNQVASTNFAPSVPTPRGGGGGVPPWAPSGVPSTPRSNASPHQVPSPRIQVGFPPATPRSHKSNKMHISRRDTAETESHTTYSQNSFSKTSPHSRSEGNVILMKSYPNFLKSHSIEDGQEVLYLGGADLGDEYGEV